MASLILSTDLLTCEGNVTIGEGATQIATSVSNKSIGGSCFNDVIVDTAAEGANYGNHVEFIVKVIELGGDWFKRRKLTLRQWRELVEAAFRSDVGTILKVRIIAFNDFHGNIDGANLNLRSDADNLFLLNANGQRIGVPAGGVDYMAGLVRQLKDGAPNNVVVSAGDLIGASPLNSALFHDEPSIETMNRLGLEFNAVGGDSFTVFNLGTDQLGGDVDLDALAAYFAARSPVALPVRDRVVQVAVCNWLGRWSRTPLFHRVSSALQAARFSPWEGSWLEMKTSSIWWTQRDIVRADGQEH